MKRIAVLRIRGTGMKKEFNDTLKMLRLTKPNHLTIVDDRPQYLGMLQKIKDFTTFGEIDLETFKKLLIKRGRRLGNKRIDENYIKEKTGKSLNSYAKEFMEFKAELEDLEIKKVFRLHPPKKGFKSIKKGYNQGGDLGYRGEAINKLIERMI